MYPVNATSGPPTITLPASTGSSSLIAVEKVDSSGNAVTVSGTINGSSSSVQLQLQDQGRLFIADGSGGWDTVASDLPLSSLDSRYVLTSSLPLSVADGGTGSATQNFVDLEHDADGWRRQDLQRCYNGGSRVCCRGECISIQRYGCGCTVRHGCPPAD